MSILALSLLIRWLCAHQITRDFFKLHRTVRRPWKSLVLASHRCTVSEAAIFPAILDPHKSAQIAHHSWQLLGPAAILWDFSGPSGANKGLKVRPLESTPLSLKQMWPRQTSEEMYSFGSFMILVAKGPAPWKSLMNRCAPRQARHIWTLITAFGRLTPSEDHHPWIRVHPWSEQ